MIFHVHETSALQQLSMAVMDLPMLRPDTDSSGGWAGLAVLSSLTSLQLSCPEYLTCAADDEDVDEEAGDAFNRMTAGVGALTRLRELQLEDPHHISIAASQRRPAVCVQLAALQQLMLPVNAQPPALPPAPHLTMLAPLIADASVSYDAAASANSFTWLHEALQPMSKLQVLQISGNPDSDGIKTILPASALRVALLAPKSTSVHFSHMLLSTAAASLVGSEHERHFAGSCRLMLVKVDICPQAFSMKPLPYLLQHLPRVLHAPLVQSFAIPSPAVTWLALRLCSNGPNMRQRSRLFDTTAGSLLAQLPFLEQLTALDISGQQLSDAIMAGFIRAATSVPLMQLVLAGNSSGSTAMYTLADALPRASACSRCAALKTRNQQQIMTAVMKASMMASSVWWLVYVHSCSCLSCTFISPATSAPAPASC